MALPRQRYRSAPDQRLAIGTPLRNATWVLSQPWEPCIAHTYGSSWPLPSSIHIPLHVCFRYPSVWGTSSVVAEAYLHMMLPMSKGVSPREAAFFSSMVSTRSTRAHSGRMPRPCCARTRRSLSASRAATYVRAVLSADKWQQLRQICESSQAWHAFLQLAQISALVPRENPGYPARHLYVVLLEDIFRHAHCRSDDGEPEGLLSVLLAKEARLGLPGLAASTATQRRCPGSCLARHSRGQWEPAHAPRLRPSSPECCLQGDMHNNECLKSR